MKNQLQKLSISILLCLAAGFLGSVFTAPAIDSWYKYLNKPVFNPPSWVFSPVWTILYILMGIALFLIWRKGLKKKHHRTAFNCFLFHLFVNFLWSILFFGVKSPGWALIDISVLWLMIVFLIYCFYEIDKRAGWLLFPYLLWVSFATVLNYNIWILN